MGVREYFYALAVELLIQPQMKQVIAQKIY